MEEKSTKFEKLEQKLREMEDRHQNEMRFMQNEIMKFRDEDQYKSMNNNPNLVGEQSNTFTHRKLKHTDKVFKGVSNNGTPISMSYNSQKQFVSHKKAMSISSSAVSNNIALPGPQSTKKKTTIRKIKHDIQNNLIKGHFMNKGEIDTNVGMMELSTRTPDKTNPELSPYMMDFYKKKRSIYEDSLLGRVRSSSSNANYVTGSQEMGRS